MYLLSGNSPSVFLARLVALLGLLLATYACVPPGEEVYAGVVVDLNDATSRRIYDHQNARQTDSLLYYLSAENPSYRYLAARAFGSFPEIAPSAIDSLQTLLGDRNELVRSAAAYSLGQGGGPEVALQLAAAFDTSGMLRDYNAAVLAAVGKTGDSSLLLQIANIKTYTARDTALNAGQAWSLFYFARRGLQTPAGDSLLVKWLLDPQTPPRVRHPAAFYLHRFAFANAAGWEAELREALRTETDPNVLMAIVRTLGRTKVPAARVALLRTLRSATDWRVRTEIVQALASFEYASIREPIVETLRDAHPLVRRTAAEFLLANGTEADATFYHQLARDSSQAEIRHVLSAAANRHLALYLSDYRGRINYDLQRAYANTSDVVQRADILRALGEFPWNYRTIYELYQQTNQAPVRTAAALALREISSRPDFAEFFRGSARRVRLDLSVYFREMIQSGAVGPAFYAAEALEEKGAIYQPLYLELDWLRNSLAAFELPKEIETYRAVDAARAALAGEPAPEPHTAEGPAKAINWGLLGSDAGREVIFRTSAGRIIIKLWPDLAPATVSSFLELVKAGYYDGKSFHRVVPNFVAQGGGPIGDGFGSEAFSLRTEVPGVRWDRPGLIGMASAGKDTEGVQFFFTHRPTPHLNNNYTSFGEVIEGQAVVDALTQGAKIESIQLR